MDSSLDHPLVCLITSRVVLGPHVGIDKNSVAMYIGPDAVVDHLLITSKRASGVLDVRQIVNHHGERVYREVHGRVPHESEHILRVFELVVLQVELDKATANDRIRFDLKEVHLVVVVQRIPEISLLATSRYHDTVRHGGRRADLSDSKVVVKDLVGCWHFVCTHISV